MKFEKRLLAVTCMTLLTMGAVVGISLNNRINMSDFKSAQATTFDYNASTVTTRRIYFVNNDNNGYWYQNYNFQAQVWYGETYSGFVDCHEIYGNYYYYVDFTSEVSGFLGGDLHFQLKVKDVEAYTNWCYNIPALNKKSADVVYINNNSPSVGTVNVGENTSIIGSVLDHYSTCVAAYSNGYYGYPQLYVDFIQPNATAIASHGDATTCEGGAYTINQKIAKLNSLYTEKGWTYTE